MSFDVFFQSFADGASARADGEEALRILESMIVDHSDGWASIVTTDGSADVHGIDDPAGGLMINHASGAAVWEVMFRLAQRAAFVIMPVGCGTYIADESMRLQLPDGVPDPVVLIHSGSDLLSCVES